MHPGPNKLKSEWADYAAVQAWCGNLSGNELTRTLSGHIKPQSSQLAEPLLTDPSLEKKAQVGNEWQNIFPKSLQAGKKPAAATLKS